MMDSPYIAAKADFSKITGKLNVKQHGANCCPPLYGRGAGKNLPVDINFRRMNFWGSRTHDWALWNPGQRMIDTHFIFPLEHADETDERNYIFGPSDAIIELCRNTGMKVFYRLGPSIEHNPPDMHFNTHPPKDFHKYAEVLAHIMRHYTKGWANGFEYDDMIYWEIWNEADLGGQMWTGTWQSFCEFFAIVLKRLKSEFPDFKIGGPAFCGLNVEKLDVLLDECDKLGVKPDFISWHSYTSDAVGLIKWPREVREYLDKRGCTETETCINEWHFLLDWNGVQSAPSTDMRRRAMEGVCGIHGIDSGCFNLAVLSGWQNEPLDSAYYYGASWFWGFYDEFSKANKNKYSMELFGRFLAECEDKVECVSRRGNIYIIGAHAKDGKSASLLVTDYRGGDSVLEVEVSGMENAKSVSAVLLDKDSDLTPADVIWKDNVLKLIKKVPGSTAFYVTFEM